MSVQEILIYAIDKFSQPGASSSGLFSGLLLIASGALWIKKYIINGNLKRYFDLKEREISSVCSSALHLESVSKKLDEIIEEQRRLFEVARK